MRLIRTMKIDLTKDEHKTLIDAQKIWQNIEYELDDNGFDICHITDTLDEKLRELLNVCENGIRLE